MNNKVIALDKNINKLLDHLTEAEDLLSLYLQLAKGNIPTKLKLTGFFINPLTILPDGAKRVARNLENKLRDAYQKDPLTYLRLSTNIPILQRIMVLEQPTSLRIIETPSVRTDLYLALNAKLNGLNYPLSDFLEEFSKLGGGFIAHGLTELWNM